MTDHTMNRLCAANPFAAGTAVDADALFGTIVLAPPDRPVARTRRRHSRRLVLVLVAVLAVGGILAVGTASGWFSHIITGPTVQAE